MEKQTNDIIEFIKNAFNGNSLKYAVVGVSGGKDSSVVAGLCVKALGKERVLGVIMPNGTMSDLSDAKALCDFLQIKNIVVNIGNSNLALVDEIDINLKSINFNLTQQAKINISPRLRMTTLYAIAGSVNGLVINTSNYSEKLLGYCTKWGDNVGDIAPLLHLTMQQVLQVGKDLELPEHLVNKKPSDGISGNSDEDNFGFTYDDLLKYINGENIEQELKNKIENRIMQNAHKNNPIPNLINQQNQ